MGNELIMSVPYFQTPNSIFENENLSTHEKLVYIYLCRCGNQGSSAFPSYQTIGDKCSMSRRAAINAVNRIVEVGLIKKRVRDQTSNIYEIMAPSESGSPASEVDSPYKELLTNNNLNVGSGPEELVNTMIAYFRQRYREEHGKYERYASTQKWEKRKQRLKAAIEYKQLDADSLSKKIDRFLFEQKQGGIEEFLQEL